MAEQKLHSHPLGASQSWQRRKALKYWILFLKKKNLLSRSVFSSYSLSRILISELLCRSNGLWLCAIYAECVLGTAIRQTISQSAIKMLFIVSANECWNQHEPLADMVEQYDAMLPPLPALNVPQEQFNNFSNKKKDQISREEIKTTQNKNWKDKKDNCFFSRLFRALPCIHSIPVLRRVDRLSPHEWLNARPEQKTATKYGWNPIRCFVSVFFRFSQFWEVVTLIVRTGHGNP